MNLFDWIRKLKKSGSSPLPPAPDSTGPAVGDDVGIGDSATTDWKARLKAKGKQSLDFTLDWLQSLRSSENIRSVQAYGTYLKLGAAAIAAYYLADTVSLFTESLIPDAPPVPPARMRMKNERKHGIEDFAAITGRNIFNSQGLIPEHTNGQGFGPARKTNLPLNLIGTVVLKNELKSIATIQDKAQNLVFPVRVDETITGKAKITKIEHLKVFFINQDNGQLEFIEIIEDIPNLHTASSRIAPRAASSGGAGIKQKDDSNFEIERGFIDKTMSNWNDLMSQARAVPSFNNGQLEGFKLISIDPGSVYEKIGLKKNDVITAVNGEALTDPGKPLQMLGELKNMNNLQISVKRGAAVSTLNYDIH